MRVLLATLCLFAGLTAIWGGVELVWSPDGSLVGLPLSLLDHTPFRDFLIPGLLLAGFVGGINTLAGVLVLRRHPRAYAEAMVSAATLATWIVVEVLLIRHVHWLHGVYLTLGIAIGAIAAACEGRTGMLGRTTGEVLLVLGHAFVGWALCAGIMAVLLLAAPLEVALFIHALAAPLVFAAVSASYFGRHRAWAPLRTAIVFSVLVALFDLVIVASFIERSLAMFQSLAGSWLPLLLVFAATWATGTIAANRTRFDHRVAREQRALVSSAAVGPHPLQPSNLPPPVDRYRAIAVGNHAPVRTMRMRHGGTFATSPKSRPSLIRGSQVFTAAPPGFVWTGRIHVAPGLWIDARDMAMGGRGNMRVAIDDTIQLANASGEHMDRGAALRLLVEMVWFPTALFDARYVTWSPVDASHARATLRFGNREVSAVFEFGPDGLPVTVSGDRYDDKGELHHWGGICRDYRSVSGLLVPFECEVYWDLPSGRFTYARWAIESIELDAA